MRTPLQLFLLALFALGSSPGACKDAEQCVTSPKAIVSDACASYATLDRLNAAVKPAIENLVQTTDFFSHYRLNLYNKQCPFWNDSDGMCGNRACAVLTLDNEDDIPEVWRARELSKLEGPQAEHPGKKAQQERPSRPLQGQLGNNVGESCVVEYDDDCDERDYCVPEDESSASKGDYVSLLENPERFTGYTGAGALQVWDAIYLENCFKKSSFPKSANLGISQFPTPGSPAAMGFKSVLEAAGRQQALEGYRQNTPSESFVSQTGLELEDECLEKRVFYRVISGMHASISTHICWEFFNQTSGEWYPNLDCYRERLHDHPEWISNLYFNFALVTRAVAKLGPSLQKLQYTYCSGDPGQNFATEHKMATITAKLATIPALFDESLMFKNGEGPSLKEDFRNRFRNISRLMDCVGCDKCRLWGKIQTAGYGTALKVLFESENNKNADVRLKRTELVALFNTYARLSNALHNVGRFREMLHNKKHNQAAAFIDDEQAEVSDKGSRKNGGRPLKPRSQRQDAIRRKTGQSDTIDDVFIDELARVVKAFKIVLKSWVRMPGWIWHIFSTESTRLWQFYIGLPVRPRSWTFQRPDIDEL